MHEDLMCDKQQFFSPQPENMRYNEDLEQNLIENQENLNHQNHALFYLGTERVN